MITTRRSVCVGVAVLALLASCGSDNKGANTSAASTQPEDPVAAAQSRVESAQAGVTQAQDSLTASGDQFCSDAKSYVEALDRYGKVLTDNAATVGDVQTRGEDLVAPQETVATAIGEVDAAKTALAGAEQELVDAQAALADAIATASSVATSTTTPGTTTTTTIVPRATIERVQQAEDDLARAGQGITAATPLTEATAEYNSAAFALQISWMKLIADAGCLTDEQHAEAVAQVTAYTAAVQTALQQAGYFDSEIDGIYGPLTVDAVKRLQADSKLPETGFVDEATSRALDQKLADLGQQTALANATHTAAVQTVLTLTGFWTAPVDGVWSDELTAALQAFQTKLGVEPTGVVDAATLAAFEQALTALKDLTTATTTTPPETTPPAPPAPATVAPTEAPPTATG